MFRVLSLLAFSFVAAGCGGDGGGDGKFRPARDAKTFPPSKRAFRIEEKMETCEKIGSVDGESIKEIAETTAKHGGTHYVVRVDETREAYETNVYPVFHGFVIVNEKVEERWMSATAYHCL